MVLKDKNLYYVGGIVRDEILGQQSFDTDFCYEGNAIEFSKELNVIKTNPDFGTVRVLINEKEIDIASTRSETYPKAGHLPIVENIGCSLKEDLKRRDFTINAMAKNTVTEEILDYFGGLEDLKNKKLQVLHESSFIDDPTRIVRGLKFSVRFGFELSDESKLLQNAYLDNVNYDMSFHRLKKELKETFNLNKDITYEKFVKEGIYKLLGKNQIPQVPTCKISELINKYTPNNTWIIYLGAFNLINFDLTQEESDIITSFNAIKNNKPEKDYDTYKLFENKPLESILLYASFVEKNIAIKYLDKLKSIKIEISGDDLIKLGIPQGKIYKEIFDFVLKTKLKNPSLDLTSELELVKQTFL